jgi:hypothetical protein
MTGAQINLKTIKAGSYITIANNSDDITITGSTPGQSNDGANVGTGAGLSYRDKTGVTLNFRSIKAGYGVAVTNNADDITLEHIVGFADLTDAATILVDAALGPKFRVTLGGNRTMDNPSNPQTGRMLLFRIKQDSTGGRLITWDSHYWFSSDLPVPVLSTSPGSWDYLGFIYNEAGHWDFISLVRGIWL